MPEYKKKSFTRDKTFSRNWFLSYVKVILGSAILAAGLVYFIIPFHIVPGGVFGVGILVNQLTGFPVGMAALLINIPLFIWGIRVLGAQFGIKAFLAVVLISGCIDLFRYFSGDRALTQDILVSAMFGGVFCGTGIALAIRAGATTGGTDIIAQIIAKYSRIQVGRLFLMVDGLIVLAGILVFRKIDMAPYAIIVIFCVSKTVDAILTGLDHRKAVFIISRHHDRIREMILKEMDRGGTYLLARGLFYTEEERRIIFSALSRKEVARLQDFIREVDPEAFMAVLDTHEIIGSGFKPFA